MRGVNVKGKIGVRSWQVLKLAHHMHRIIDTDARLDLKQISVQGIPSGQGYSSRNV